MKMVFDWLPSACRDGGNLEARERMQNAATIAGLGFGNSNTGLSHALGHAAGAQFHIPHGRAIGIALPYSLDYIVSRPPVPGAPGPLERLALAGRFVGCPAEGGHEAARGFIARVRALQTEVGEPSSLREAGVEEGEMNRGMEALVRLGKTDPNMYTTPCACEEEDLRELFQIMWSGSASS
jgi:acetaldehyde dehydrogenase/alcohol dehydrogenase